MSDEELLKDAETWLGRDSLASIAASLLVIARNSALDENAIRVDEQMLHVDNQITTSATHKAIAKSRLNFLKGATTA